MGESSSKGGNPAQRLLDRANREAPGADRFHNTGSQPGSSVS